MAARIMDSLRPYKWWSIQLLTHCGAQYFGIAARSSTARDKRLASEDPGCYAPTHNGVGHMPVSPATVQSAHAVKAPNTSARVTSLDTVRGIAMILMAIDHVRVYSGVPAGGPTFGVFFTRWITNFVAPAFVFLAGTSAYLYGRKCADRWSLSKFLASRGVWLIFLELTFLRIAWTFTFDFQHYLLAGVIWMLGWSMIALAGAVYLPRPAIAAIGIALIALHNLTNLFRPQIAHAFGNHEPNWLLRI